jgi:hypothetical protein
MGGATLRIADVDVENQAYSTSAGTDKEATIISLSLFILYYPFKFTVN